MLASLVALFPSDSLKNGELRSMFQRGQPSKVNLPFNGFAPAGVCNHVHHEEDGDGWKVVRCTERAITSITLGEKTWNLPHGLLCLKHQRVSRRINYRNPTVEADIIAYDKLVIRKAQVRVIGNLKVEV